jgi:hypothetical protein
MRTKKVNRYWCDFCNKAGLQAGAMRKHELHCTLNADRKCRVCAMIGDNMTDEECEAKVPLADLIVMLPDSAPYHAQSFGRELEDTHTALTAALVAILPSFRLAAGGCPACMMAALRLAKIPVPMVEGFSFTEEMKEIWVGINDSRESQRGYDY